MWAKKGKMLEFICLAILCNFDYQCCSAPMGGRERQKLVNIACTEEFIALIDDIYNQHIFSLSINIFFQ